MLDEFYVICDYHRKCAIKLLLGRSKSKKMSGWTEKRATWNMGSAGAIKQIKPK